MSRVIKLKEFSDGNILITTHQYYKLKPKRIETPIDFNSNIVSYSCYMSCRDYSLLLKRHYKKLFDKELFRDNPYFFTLTINNYMSTKDLLKKLHNFFVGLNRHFGKFEYFRTLEHNSKYLLHCHILISFYNKPIGLNSDYVSKHLWKLGFVCVKEVSSFMGVLEYLTTFKTQNRHPKTKFYTHFFKGTKIISMSEKFIIGKKTFKEYTIDENQYKRIIKDNEHLNSCGGFMKIDSHNYFDDDSQKSKTCIDRVYIRYSG